MVKKQILPFTSIFIYDASMEIRPSTNFSSTAGHWLATIMEFVSLFQFESHGLVPHCRIMCS